MKPTGKGAKKEATMAQRLLYTIIAPAPPFRYARRRTPLLAKPNQRGSTDSSQRLVDFTEARRIGLPAGDVDKYRTHRRLQ